MFKFGYNKHLWMPTAYKYISFHWKLGIFPRGTIYNNGETVNCPLFAYKGSIS